MPTNADLGQAVRRLRWDRDITIEQLALDANIHPTYLSGIERGIRNPSWSKICALSVALNMSVVVLARRAEDEAYVAARVRKAREELSAQADHTHDAWGA
jgi:transcriptional regulator with XRE-family HTH domain